MRYLPLYDALPRSVLDESVREAVDSACGRCNLSSGVRNACIAADGELGGVLVVGEYPGRVDDALGRPHAGEGGRALRKLVEKYWPGPAVYDYAVRCAPGRRQVKPKHAEACRPYLARVVDEVAPERIVAVGPAASYALFGRSVQARENRRCYAYLFPRNGRPIPVFHLQSYSGAARNRFLRRYFEEDLAWALTCARPELPPVDADARVIETRADAEEAVAALRAAPPATFDVETCGRLFDPSFRILSLSACGAGESDAWVWDRAALDDPDAIAPLLAWLRDVGAPKTGTNVKYDENAAFTAFGVDVRGVVGDVRLWRKLLAADASGALDRMVEHIGMGGMKEENESAMAPVVKRIRKGLEVERRLARQREEDAALARAGSAPKRRAPLRPEARAGLEELQRIDLEMPDLAQLVRDPNAEWRSWAYALVPDDVLTRYNARDAVGTERVRAWVEPQLRADSDLDAVRTKIVDRAAHAVRKVEGWGILVDRPALESFDMYLAAQLAPVRARLDVMAGPDFNPLSPPQCGELLFGRLGLQHNKKTQTGKQSTDGDVLEELASKHPVAHAILEYRTIAKMRGTYAGGMIPHIRQDGRVHTSILLDGAESGRTSSQNPNLQNIPRAKDSPEGKMARDVFVARPGYFLLELDYSQLEYRIAAMLSKDPVMRRIFEEGHDCHQRTAELISQIAWGIPPSAVMEVHRTKAKAVNFAILYGKTARTLSHEWGISLPATERVVNAITGNFKVLAGWCGDMLAQLRKSGEIRTWWAGRPGRRRPLWRVADPEDGIRRHAENSAVNCLDADTEALTRRGWVRGFDLRKDDVLLTKNPVSGALEWQGMTDLRLWPDYDGPVVEFRSRSFHAVSTPEHRWLVTDKASGAWVERTTRTLSSHGDHRIHRTGDYRPAVVSSLSPDEAELLGWFVTDGSIRTTSEGPPGKRGPKRRAGGKRAMFHQSISGNPTKVTRIDALLARVAPFARKSLSRDGTYATWNLGPEMTGLLLDHAPARTLTIAALLRLDRVALDRLREAMLLGDGTQGTKDTLCTGRQEQAEAFQALCTLTGSAASIVWRDMSKYKPTSAKMKNVPKMTGVWVVTILRRETAQIVQKQRREITGKVPVWCPVVPNTFFVARRSGHVFITGNTPVQGTASEFCVASLADVVDWVEGDGLEEDCRPVLPIHDALLIEVRREMVVEAAETTREIMLAHDSDGVPLEVDAKVGRAFGSMIKFPIGDRAGCRAVLEGLAT